MQVRSLAGLQFLPRRQPPPTHVITSHSTSSRQGWPESSQWPRTGCVGSLWSALRQKSCGQSVSLVHEHTPNDEPSRNRHSCFKHEPVEQSASVAQDTPTSTEQLPTCARGQV